jgi:hypothetical protein
VALAGDRCAEGGSEAIHHGAEIALLRDLYANR